MKVGCLFPCQTQNTFERLKKSHFRRRYPHVLGPRSPLGSLVKWHSGKGGRNKTISETGWLGTGWWLRIFSLFELGGNFRGQVQAHREWEGTPGRGPWGRECHRGSRLKFQWNIKSDLYNQSSWEDSTWNRFLTITQKYKLPILAERVTFWLQRARSLPCPCVFAVLYVCAIA